MGKDVYYSFKLPKVAIVVSIVIVAAIVLIESTFNVADRMQRSIFGVSQGVTLEGVTIQRHLDHELSQYIKEYAQENKYKAEDARIDSVWKGIPGINGLEVDIEKTMEKAFSAKRNEDVQFQYRQWKPEINLSDLGAVPIYRGNAQKQAMALMINVSWGTEYIENILEVLEKNNVKVTFFVAGNWVENNQETLLQIYLAGHEIGSHAYTHRNMSTLDRQELVMEMQKTDQWIQKSLPHIKTSLFAPPSGDFNQQVVDVAHSLDKRTILWTLDTIDWQRPDPSVIVNRIVPKAENGALVLMHPTEPTVEALKMMIPRLLESDYTLMTVSELLSTQRNDIVKQMSNIGFP